MNDIMRQQSGTTPLSAEELEGLLHKHVTTHGELNELEQANIDQGLKWQKKQTNPPVLTELFLKNLHKQLFGAVWRWAGDFRLTEKKTNGVRSCIATWANDLFVICLLYTSPSPRDQRGSRMPSSA